MKKTIITAVAAIMMTSGAHAACSTKADVVAFNNVNTYNKSMLSDRDKCWHDVYTEENHGVDGSVFWLRVGGEYYSTQLINLKTKEQRDAFLANVNIDVTNTLNSISVVSDEVQSLTKTIETIKYVVDETALNILKEQLTAKQAEFDALQISFNNLVDINGQLEADKIALSGTITGLNGEITNLNGQIADLKAEVADLKAQRQSVADALGSSYKTDAIIKAIEVRAAALKSAVNARNAAQNQFARVQNLLGLSNSNGSYVSYGEYLGVQAAIHKLQKQVAKVTNASLTGKGERYGYDVSNKSAGSIPGEDDGGAYTDFTLNGEAVVLDDPNKVDFPNGRSFTLYHSNTIADVIADIESALESAYDQGYADGYEAGYADGFADGVASVQ